MCRHKAGPGHSAHPYPQCHATQPPMTLHGQWAVTNQDSPMQCHLAACIVQVIGGIHCNTPLDSYHDSCSLPAHLSPAAVFTMGGTGISAANVVSWVAEGHGIGDMDGPSGMVLHCGGTILCRQMEYSPNVMRCAAMNQWHGSLPIAAPMPSVPCYSACLSAMCAPSTIHPSIYPNIHYHVLPVPQ